ncbi:MAG: hypothetical protein VB997_08925 [Opitutales bacterium]
MRFACVFDFFEFGFCGWFLRGFRWWGRRVVFVLGLRGRSCRFRGFLRRFLLGGGSIPCGGFVDERHNGPDFHFIALGRLEGYGARSLGYPFLRDFIGFQLVDGLARFDLVAFTHVPGG